MRLQVVNLLVNFLKIKVYKVYKSDFVNLVGLQRKFTIYIPFLDAITAKSECACMLFPSRYT